MSFGQLSLKVSQLYAKQLPDAILQLSVNPSHPIRVTTGNNQTNRTGNRTFEKGFLLEGQGCWNLFLNPIMSVSWPPSNNAINNNKLDFYVMLLIPLYSWNATGIASRKNISNRWCQKILGHHLLNWSCLLVYNFFVIFRRNFMSTTYNWIIIKIPAA